MVHQFRYLGLNLVDSSTSPDHVLRDRLECARKAFNAIRANARRLGLHNRRVRVQLVGSLVVSSLTYGGVLFACLGDEGMSLSPSCGLFR